MPRARTRTFSANASALSIVGYFLIGMVVAGFLDLIGEVIASSLMSMMLLSFWNSSVAQPMVIVFVGRTIASLLVTGVLAAATHRLFKARSGPPLVYVAGVFVWCAAMGVRKTIYASSAPGGFSALQIATSIEITLLFTTTAWCFARKGTRAQAQRFRTGSGTTCAHCHYDLSATAEGVVCPECGGTLRYDKAKPKPGL